jgi:hypothetical protein
MNKARSGQAHCGGSVASNDSADRRGFLKLGMAGLLGLSLPDILRIEAQAGSRKTKADGVILIWLYGGPATIDMWDLKPDAPEEYRGDFKPIDTKAQGVMICEHLPKVAEIMDRSALVRSLTHPIVEHNAASEYMATGHPPSAALKYPSLGSIASKLLPSKHGVPSFITLDRPLAFPSAGGYLGTTCDAFNADLGGRNSASRVDGISLPSGFTAEQLTDRDRLRGAFDNKFRSLDDADLPVTLDRFQQQAVDILRSDRIRTAFDLSAEKEALRNRYGQSPLGTCALTARRLIEAGARFVTIGLGNWDTHTANFTTMRQRLLPELDRVLSALVIDLKESGLLERTVVYCAGEFGRTPRINSSSGRDHWSRSMAVFLSGGGIKSGIVHGSTDARGLSPEEDPCTPADVSATILSLLGIDPTSEVRTQSGRPVTLFRDGKIIEGLVS